jgi:hypothetical protein
MSYSYPYAQQPVIKPKRPKFISMLAGFAISSVVGIVFAQISSFVYSLLGQGGGMECLTLPITLVIFGGSLALSTLITRKLNQKTNLPK